MPSTLIVGTSYIATEHQRMLCELWFKLNRKLNPACDLLVLDSMSPIAPQSFLHEAECTRGIKEDGIPRLGSSFNVVSFKDNIGHLFQGGSHGAGRAFCKAMEIAIANDYDYLAIVETDMLFARPILPILQKMQRYGLGVCCPWDGLYSWIETGLMFFSTDYLQRSCFIQRYNWRNPPRDKLPEIWAQELLQEDLFLLPLRGLRNDDSRLSPHNFQAIMPHGIDYLTHCYHLSVYHQFLETNGITLP